MGGWTRSEFNPTSHMTTVTDHTSFSPSDTVCAVQMLAMKSVGDSQELSIMPNVLTLAVI